MLSPVKGHASIVFVYTNTELVRGSTPNTPERSCIIIRNRDEGFYVFFTQKEKEHLRKQADTAGYKMGAFIRALIAGSKLQPKPPLGKGKLLDYIKKNSDNINQLVRYIHENKVAENEVDSSTLFIKFCQINTEQTQIWEKVKDL